MTHTIDGIAVAGHDLLEALGPQVQWLAKLVRGLGDGPVLTFRIKRGELPPYDKRREKQRGRERGGGRHKRDWQDRLREADRDKARRVRMWPKGKRAKRRKARKLAHRMRLANRRR
jgi:hypothetical protein